MVYSFVMLNDLINDMVLCSIYIEFFKIWAFMSTTGFSQTFPNCIVFSCVTPTSLIISKFIHNANS